jgi:hypothetical protein
MRGGMLGGNGCLEIASARLKKLLFSDAKIAERAERIL